MLVEAIERLNAVRWTPAFDPERLREHYARTQRLVGEHARLVVARRALVPPPFDAAPIQALYGDLPGRASHVFRAEPLDWGFSLTEAQTTRGLAHFLNASPWAVLRRRAFLEAFGIAVGPEADLSTHSVHAEVEAKQVPGWGDRARKRTGRRIDLLVLWQEGTTRRALAVEAKFGHRLTANQLSGYLQEVRQRLGVPDPHLVVLGLAERKGDTRRLARNRAWRYRTWGAILLGFERALGQHAAEDDDAEFACFRRTLWQRVGQGHSG